MRFLTSARTVKGKSRFGKHIGRFFAVASPAVMRDADEPISTSKYPSEYFVFKLSGAARRAQIR
jgi:hypothetical protein